MNEEYNEHTIQCLIDMFNMVSHDAIRTMCEKNNWNLDACIDKLMQENSNNIEGSFCGLKATDTSLSKPISYSGIAQGAKAKTFSPHNKMRKLYSDEAIKPIINDGWHSTLELKIGEDIRAGYRIMILMRGPPGSGKTHLSQSLVRNYVPIHYRHNMRDFIFSSDDYFIDTMGRYRYNVNYLGESHECNHRRVEEKATNGWSPIIVDNTNMKLWEMLPYAKAAVQNGYILEMLEPSTPWRRSSNRLAMMNTHGVSRESIERMLLKWEDGTVDDLIKMLKKTKYTMPLPQMRNLPPVVFTSSSLPSDMEIEETVKFVMQESDKSSDSTDIDVPNPDNEHWSSYNTDLPKVQRIGTKTYGLLANKSDNDNSWSHKLETIDFINLESSNTKNNEIEKEMEILQTQQADEINNKVSKEMTQSSPTSSNRLLALLREDVNNEETSVKSMELTNFKCHRINCPNENSSFASLRQIYPNKSLIGLWDLFVKCNGDINWVVDILLKEDNDNDNDDRNNDELICTCSGSDDNVTTDFMSDINSSTTVSPKAKPQRQRWKFGRYGREGMCQEIENNIKKCFVLDDKHYSDHLLKIRNIRRNNNTFTIADGHENIPNNLVHMETQTEDVMVELDSSNEDNDDESDDKLEISLGEHLIQQLFGQFHTQSPLLDHLPYVLPTNVNIFLPKTVAKKLYILYLEAVYDQIEEKNQKIIENDEEFARLLKNPRYEECTESPTNVREILDMEMAWTIYKQDKEAQEYQLKQQEQKQPIDLATYLTQIKLCELFPDIPRDTLIDLLAESGNSYGQTVSLLRSTMSDSEREIASSTITREQLKEYARNEKELLKIEMQKRIEDHYKNTIIITNPEIAEQQRYAALQKFEETRNLAAHHNQLRYECYTKAREAIIKGYGEVGTYYSEIANLHKTKVDLYNQVAAGCIIEVHRYTHNNPDLLDLHYLYIPEALECLDIFLDSHIFGLRDDSRNWKDVYIITGRGRHSIGGMAVIRNKVRSRLKERNLRWQNENAGLLKVRVYAASRPSKN